MASELDRFVQAQQRSYATALAELKRGRKESHWIWYVLPQLRGLGISQMSRDYGITGLAEARAYLAHPVLGPRLVACTEAILAHAGQSAKAILGDLDALKFQSCLTLFSCAAPDDLPVFKRGLQEFFGGQPDARTLQLLGMQRPSA